ncbi:MAG: amidohydrolase family protein [Candidatus Bathyarchaeota archaeon]|nr:amidohydrolase family protein [Candidatus Bathyarchaeota archaeon]
MLTGKNVELKAGVLLIGDGRLLENANIGIKEGVIHEVSVDKLEEDYDDAVDLSNRFVMPGLIDAHVHIRYGPKQETVPSSDEYQTIRGLENARKALSAGVTSLGDAGAIRNVGFAVRNAINDGLAVGPRLFVSGEMITMTGGRSKKPGDRLEVDGEDSARKAARSLLMYKGADFIKLGTTGAISSAHTGPRHPQLTVPEMRACTEEAHKCGKMVHSHCYGEAGINNSLEAGVDVIVHGQSLNERHLRLMKQRDMILMPTLKTFCGHLEHLGEGGVHDRIVTTGIWEETEPNFRNALENEIIISMGTDCGMPDNHFGDNPKDLEYMVNWGMTPMQAVTAGTLNAAKSLAVEDKLGTIKPRKLADLLVLKKDPLKDIRHVWNSLEYVILNGRFL